MQSRELFERVLQQRLSTFGEMHDDTLNVFIRLIWLDLQEGRKESGIALTQRAANIFASLHPAGAFTRALNIKALLQPYKDQNRPKEAEIITTRLQETLRTVFGANHPEIHQLLADCSALMKDANRQMAAWHLQSRADIIQKKEATNPWAERLNVPTNIVDGIPELVDQSNVELARERARLMAMGYSRGDAAPERLPLTAEQLCQNGQKALISGLYDSALSSYLAALEISRKLNDRPMISDALRQISRIHLEIDMLEGAEKFASEAAEIDRAFYGKDSHFLSEDEFLLSDTLRRQGKFAQARERLEAATLIRIKLYGEAHSETLSGILRLIWIDLEEDNQQSLLEDIQYSNDIYFQCHLKQTFAELIDLKSLLRPYIERERLQEAQSILQRMQSAAASIFGENEEQFRNIERECLTLINLMGSVTGESNRQAKIQFAQSRPIAVSSARRTSHDVVLPPRANPSLPQDAVVPQTEEIYQSTFAGIGSVPAQRVDLIRKGLNLSGVSSDSNLILYAAWTCALGTAGCSAVIYYLAGYASHSIEAFLLTVPCVLALLLFALCIKIMLRQKQLERQMPYALEIIVSLLRAGTPISEAFEEVSKSIAMPLRAEFQRLVAALKQGRSFSQALEEMGSYVNDPRIALLSDAIHASRSSGGGLAKQVATLASELREQEKERGVLSKSLAPLTILVAVIAPAAIKCLITIPFNPSVGAVLLDASSTKLILLFVYCCPFLAWFRARRSEKKSRIASSSNEPATLGTAFNRFLKREKMRYELSRFLDLVVIHVQSGVSLTHAVHKVINEGKGSCPNLSRELGVRLKDATSFKHSLPLALKSLGQEYDFDELLTLAATIEATMRLGGSVGKQLQEQASSLRDHLQKTGRARAASAYSTGMLIGIMLFIVFLLISKLLAPNH